MAMARKNRFPPDTKPNIRAPKTPIDRQSGPAPKDARAKSEAPTLPPPPTKKGRHTPARPRRSEAPRNSGVQSRRPAGSKTPAATLDEVTADMSNDPRREREDED